MLLYNVTTKIQKSIETNWLEWMKTKHIPDVMNTKQFIESRICRLLDQPDENETTYVIQYHCKNIETFNYYTETFAPALREEYNKRYKDQFVVFRTVMEVVGNF